MLIFFRQGIEVVRDGYEVFGVEFATLDEHPLSRAEIDFRLVDLLEPGVLMSLREPEEQSFDLDAFAVIQKRLQPPGTQAPQAFRQSIYLMEAFVAGQFVEQFEERTFGRRYHERPVEWSRHFPRCTQV